MLSPRSRIGRSAEIVAAAELGRRGYRIIASNYRSKYGEIDFITEEGGSIAFVEVRCKRTTTFGSPAESVTVAKRRKLVATAECYLEERSLRDVCCRFDIVEVIAREGRLLVADVIQDAFSA